MSESGIHIAWRMKERYLEKGDANLCDDQVDRACEHHDDCIRDGICHVAGAVVAQVGHELP